jgi:hypothetical protein
MYQERGIVILVREDAIPSPLIIPEILRQLGGYAK